MELKIIGKMRTDFPGKFGIPRQSGLVKSLKGKIVLEPEYRQEGILRGIEGFSHLWIMWMFSENLDEQGEAKWSPTVRPPRLGGNTRMGVFATRSPFRPNPIGLSAVKVIGVDYDCVDAPVIYVEGADMVDGTPIVDIKPYVPFTDAIDEASGGFTDEVEYKLLKVVVADDSTVKEVFDSMDADIRDSLVKILANDPRPHYHNDPERVYRFEFSDYSIGFRVIGEELVIESLRNIG